MQRSLQGKVLNIIIFINPQKPKKMAYTIDEKCTACGTCLSECPVDAIQEGDIYKIDAELCTDCGACEMVCPAEAIKAS